MNYGEISVTAPLERAFERVKRVLFQPFDIGKWFIIGFGAWLAYLGEGGGGGGGFNGVGNRHPHGDAGTMVMEARDYVLSNLYWIVPVALFVFVIVLAIWVALVWLSSRGRFMFLDCVVKNRGAVKEPWRNYAAEADSLFLFRIMVGLVVGLPIMAAVVGIVLVVVSIVGNSHAAVLQVAGLIMLTLTAALFGVAGWILKRLLTDFVVPLQFLKKERCMDAWREVLSLVSSRLGAFALYFLFRIVLSLAIVAVVIAVVLLTCCIAGCFLALPYIGTVLMLPILVFERSYSAYFLAQFGPQYDVFSLEAAI